MTSPDTATTLEVQPRAAEDVMRLARMGAFHQTRLSFLRVLLRQMARDRWTVKRALWELDDRGVGQAVYSARGPERTYSLVCFSHDLAPEQRTDRVIAEAWDSTFALFDGVPTRADIERLSQNVPRQEAGRCSATELVLSRANKSVRMHEHVVERLAAGLQPDQELVESVGYLMRTTAVYGNGKFGLADRDRIAGRPEFAGPFRAEMLTVWLIRAFTVDLVEHIAKRRSPNRAVRLSPELRRQFGVGNSTGLGMAPFLIKHPALIHKWIEARERALARVRSLPNATPSACAHFRRLTGSARANLARWVTDDAKQRLRIAELISDLSRLESRASGDVFNVIRPWDALFSWAEANLSLEAQEYTVTLLLEPHGALIDDLAEAMAVDEDAVFRIDGTMSCAQVRAEIERMYAWALATDFSQPDSQARFWYVSEEKLEPRLGERRLEPGSDLEQPLAIARDIASFHAALATTPSESLAGFLLRNPEHRHVARRVQIAARHPYAEIRDNLIDAQMRPIDLLRCKLAFFGATRFDPRSDRWLRITLYQGAPYPDELSQGDGGDWMYSRSGGAAS